MKYKVDFSKKDFAIALACVVFLLIGLGAVGDGGRRRAKEAVCLSNLRQWGGKCSLYGLVRQKGWAQGALDLKMASHV